MANPTKRWQPASKAAAMVARIFSGELSHKGAAEEYGVSLHVAYARTREARANLSDADRICMEIKRDLRRERRRAWRPPTTV